MAWHLPQDSIGAELHRKTRLPGHVDALTLTVDGRFSPSRAGEGS